MEENKEEYIKRKSWWSSRKYFFRQLLITSGAWTCYFILGLSFGASTVFIPQIRAEAHSYEAVSESVASWIPTVLIYAGMPWTFILPVMMKTIGRKYTFMFVSVMNLISFVVLYCSATITQIIISEVINGINNGAHFTVSVMIIAEYTSPKYRGFFLTCKSAMLFWGIFVANAIGTFFNWKNIAIIGIACSIYSILISLFYPESPYWLNTKHRIEKCSKSHRWLKGIDEQSEQELEKMIEFQKDIENKRAKNVDYTILDVIKTNVKIISKKRFYKPLLLAILVQSLYIFSGKIVFSVYAIDIIQKISKEKEISAYAVMLILDGVTVTSMYIGCVFAKMLPRRKLLISTALTGILFLLSISFYTFLIKLGILEANNYVTLALMTGYSIGIACGPVILAQALSGEMVSLEFRALSSCFMDLYLKINLGTLVKVSPYLFKTWGADGAFLFYGIICFIMLILIYKFLPETKDKTLQEIAELINNSYKKPVSKEKTRFLARNKKLTTRPY